MGSLDLPLFFKFFKVYFHVHIFFNLKKLIIFSYLFPSLRTILNSLLIYRLSRIKINIIHFVVLNTKLYYLYLSYLLTIPYQWVNHKSTLLLA